MNKPATTTAKLKEKKNIPNKIFRRYIFVRVCCVWEWEICAVVTNAHWKKLANCNGNYREIGLNSFTNVSAIDSISFWKSHYSIIDGKRLKKRGPVKHKWVKIGAEKKFLCSFKCRCQNGCRRLLRVFFIKYAVE